MKTMRLWLMRLAPQRWRSSVPFLLALATLVFLGWSAVKAITYPDDGIRSLRPTGAIGEIDPNGPAYNKLKVGDIIISHNGILQKEVSISYVGNRAGDQVQFVVQRGGKTIPVWFTLVKPPLDEIFRRLMPLLVALTFWAAGVSVQAFAPASEATILFFVFCMIDTVFITAGMSSTIGPAWSSLFNFLLWLVGPVSVHFHLYFPQTTFLKGKRYLLIGLYCLALLGGLPYLIWGSQIVRSSSWFTQIFSAGRLFLAINLLVAVGLLFYAYRHASSPGVRGKIRMVVLGGVLSALPFVTLIILPDALLQRYILPIPYAFLLLGILPMTYGFAIYRYRLIEIEKHVNRGATYILVYSILGSFYLVLYFILHRILPLTMAEEPLVNTVLVLVLASVFVPLHQWVKRIVDTVFYGGWYDYRSAVVQITQGIEQVTDLKTLARTIGERLVKTLRLEDTCVFFSDLKGDFSVIEVSPKERAGEESPLSIAALPRSSLEYLLNVGEVEKSSLRKALSEISLTPEEHQLLNSEQVHLWIPIIGYGQVEGFLALGPKFGGDVFSGEDLDILRVVARQLGPVIENIHLLNRLRQHANELEQRVKERTDELHDAKERVEAILASVGDGVIVTDLSGEILTVNAAFEDQTSYRSEELVGQNLLQFLSEQNEPRILDEMRKILQKGDVWRGELINRRKGGAPYDIHLTMAPVRDQNRKMVSYVGSLRDITRQKELDRLKDLFVSDVSHELRTPTTNISLYLELLESATMEKRNEYLAVLKEQGQLLRRLVEDILDISRLAIKKSEKSDFMPVNLNLLAEQVVTAHQPMAETSGVALDFKPEPELPYIFGDEGQLTRVITNLVSNALRYTIQGQVIVSTYLSEKDICLEVQDTGIGIDPDDRPHLFERFYRGKQVRQTKIHGTGLGLAIVKEIIDLHQGFIDLQTEIDKGSTFTIRFPIETEKIWLEKQY
jgi:two-component system NtrC family sensor kinase